MKRHQRLLPQHALPDAAARFAQRAAIEAVLLDAGYQAIGLDHFARPEDPLARTAATGGLRRNFQGYTADRAAVLLGIGASAIGSLPQGYVQNATKVLDYTTRMKSGALPIARGVALSGDDKLRRAIIETLMCRLSADPPAIAARFHADPRALAPDAELDDMAADGLVRWDGERLEVTALGRPFVRSVAAVFDTYLERAPARYAAAV